MLSNLKVKQKLLVLVVPLILAIIVLAALGIRERLSSASAASSTTLQLDMIRDTADLANNIDSEMLAVVGEQAGASTDRQAAQERVDAAAEQFLATYDEGEFSLDSDDLQLDLDELRQGVEEFDGLRSSVATLDLPIRSVIEYRSVTHLLQGFRTALARDESVSGISRELGHTEELATVLHHDFLLSSYTLAAESDPLPAEAEDELRSSLSQYEASIANVAELGTGGPEATALVEELQGQSGLQSLETFNEVRRDALGYTGEELIPLASAAGSISIDVFEAEGQSRAERFNEVRENALVDLESGVAGDKDASDSAAIWYSLATLIMVAIAAVLAILVTRSIVTPLRRLTDAAYDLAN